MGVKQALLGPLVSGASEWGGWGSNPRPTDYESSPPAALVRAADLGRHRRARGRSGRFWHVLGMISSVLADAAGFQPSRRSLLRAVVDLRAVVNVEDVDNTAVLIDPVNDAVGASPGAVTAN
jgi:hypothetical protein